MQNMIKILDIYLNRLIYWAVSVCSSKGTKIMTAISSSKVPRLAMVLSALLFAYASALPAQVVIVPTTPQIGSSNPITAAPLVPRPNTQPCVVQLFQNLAFADFNLKSFSYTPPSGCPGPWAKVVFTADRSEERRVGKEWRSRWSPDP